MQADARLLARMAHAFLQHVSYRIALATKEAVLKQATRVCLLLTALGRWLPNQQVYTSLS